ncbi:MAG: GntR family transcriptional regulator [Gammaproteobacteria bacterium]|nr:GntR family transcriptional regulator [Gammaproteobacteria bacterium]MDP6617242.1 GntR family transcriptional regulator [Gammaproteobacteria bacterium]MDP6695828.1 GntR family transcriptional regulator [Gammaproteobacteria bacterium]
MPRPLLPLYHQVYLTLREQILDGKIAGGSVLPSEHKLATRFGVSRVTLRRTLQLLENDRLVERRQGVGTRVTLHHYKYDELFDLGQITGNAEIDGIRKFPTHSAELIATPKALAKKFEGHAQLVHLLRIRQRDGTPYSTAYFYIPIPVMKNVDMKSTDDKPMLTSVVDAGYTLKKAQQTINAVSANETNAELLNIPVGSPLLFMTGSFEDPDGNTLMHTEGFFRPEYYEYRSTTYRKVGKDGRPLWGPKP